MLRYIAGRLVAALVVLWLVVTVTFFLMHAIPGGPYDRERKIPDNIRANVEKRYHLDEPLWKQYADYLHNLVRFDLGPSLKNEGRTVNDLIAEFFPRSAILGALALVLALGVGVPAGVISALRRNRWQDHAVMFAAIVGVSVPSFILGTVLLYLFALKLRWLPAAGWGSWRELVMPAIALASFALAYIARLTRISLLDVLGEDYIRTARAKGLPGGRVVVFHALRNALIPLVTYLGPQIAAILTGSFVVEYIFAIPGLGRFFVTSIYDRDYTVILGLAVFYAAFLVLMNLLVDLFYVVLDPRISLEKEKVGG
ncbi:MAG: ABC transporter permease [bacterium]